MWEGESGILISKFQAVSCNKMFKAEPSREDRSQRNFSRL
jgi:hypothetical protein